MKEKDITIQPSIQLIRSKIPDIVYEAERYFKGEIGDHPDATEYILEVQKFFRNCIGFDSPKQKEIYK